MARLRLSADVRLALGGGSEDSDQRQLARMLDSMGLLWCHTPNEQKRDERERGAALARGLKTGVPDVMIYRPHPGYAGLAIELKRGDATPCDVRDEQRLWLSRLREAGWMAEWCRGYSEAVALVRAAYGQGGR